MNLNRYDTLFEEFLTKIALTKTQATKINDKLEETLSLFLTAYEGDVEVFAQGSYVMGTTVRPLTANQSPAGNAGEYDIDIALERATWGDAKPSLENVRSLLLSEYENLVDKKLRETCERVHHDIDDDTGVGFHVDYVPIKHMDVRKAAKRSENKWFPSDTKELLAWFQEYSEEFIYLPAIILTIKRMRDFAGLTDDMPSICITALVTMYYEDHGSYAADLLNVLDGISTHLSVPYDRLSINIDPVKDDLAKKLSTETHAKLLTFFKECRDNLRSAFNEEDLEIIRQYLSNSFPQNLDRYPYFLESLRNRNLGIELNGSLYVTDITESHGKGSHIKRNVRRFFGTGDKLIFRANEKEKSQFGIRWQVLNSPKSPRGKRRGKLFKACGADGVEGSSSNRFVNHETEQYDGEHWIKYYTYDKSSRRVVEIGRKFYVDVNK